LLVRGAIARLTGEEQPEEEAVAQECSHSRMIESRYSCGRRSRPSVASFAFLQISTTRLAQFGEAIAEHRLRGHHRPEARHKEIRKPSTESDSTLFT
jgi:hypothetical protein